MGAPGERAAALLGTEEARPQLDVAAVGTVWLVSYHFVIKTVQSCQNKWQPNMSVYKKNRTVEIKLCVESGFYVKRVLFPPDGHQQ